MASGKPGRAVSSIVLYVCSFTDRFGLSGIEIGSNINGVMLGESLT